MNKKLNIEYLTPEVSVHLVEYNGILCSSSEGNATTDDFVMGDDISDIF